MRVRGMNAADLYRGEDGGHVVCGGPASRQNVQADRPVSIHVRVEHLAHKSKESVNVAFALRI